MRIEVEVRPCMVEGKRALFHKWSDKSRIVAPSMMIGGHPGGIVKSTVGIIEYESGEVDEVLPREIKFLDGKHKDFCFYE